MIVAEYLNGGTLIRHYSDRNMLLEQVETGERYPEPIDIVPCPYTYTETDEPIEDEATAEEIVAILTGEPYDKQDESV